MKIEGINLGSLKIQLNALAKMLRPFFKHIVFISILASLGFLIFAAYSITNILNQPTDDSYRTTKELTYAQTKFDQNTIKLVLGLKLLTDPNARVTFNDFSIKRTRLSPFTE